MSDVDLVEVVGEAAGAVAPRGWRWRSIRFVIMVAAALVYAVLAVVVTMFILTVSGWL